MKRDCIVHGVNKKVHLKGIEVAPVLSRPAGPFSGQLTGQASLINLRRLLVSGSIGSIGLFVGSRGLMFLVSVLLARSLGSGGLGMYTYALAWTEILGVPAKLGVGQLLTREVSAYSANSEWGLMAGLLKWAHKTTLFASLAVIVIAALVYWTMRAHLESPLLIAMLLALLVVPLSAMIHVRVKALIGLHQIVRGQLPELLCHPLLFLTLASFCSYLLLESFTASWAIGLNIVALGISLVVSGVLFRLALTPAIRAASPDFNKSAWFSSALSLMAVGGMNILNSRMDILMLGSLGSPEDVGVYHIANRGAEFVLLILGPVHTALGPMISSTYARRDFVGLQALVTSTNRVLSLLALPIAAGLLLFAVPFLSLFGKGYTDGRIALSIMATGHFFTLLLGPVALLLSMTQYERVAAKAMASSVVLNLILNAVLIPRYGLNGAAIATMSSKLMATVLMGTVVFATLRINPTVMGSRHSERAMNQSP